MKLRISSDKTFHFNTIFNTIDYQIINIRNMYDISLLNINIIHIKYINIICYFIIYFLQ